MAREHTAWAGEYSEEQKGLNEGTRARWQEGADVGEREGKNGLSRAIEWKRQSKKNSTHNSLLK